MWGWGHSLLMKSESISHSVVSDSLQPQGLQPARPLWPRDSPRKNTGVGCHALLQGIFLIKGWNLHLLHWQADSFPSEPPEILPAKGITALPLADPSPRAKLLKLGLRQHCGGK